MWNEQQFYLFDQIQTSQTIFLKDRYALDLISKLSKIKFYLQI